MLGDVRGWGVGVTLEDRFHRFAAGVNGVGEAGKNPRIRSARRGIRKCGRRAPGALGKGSKKFQKLFFKKVCENTYVGAAVKIGIVDRTTTTIGRWLPTS